MKKVLKLSVAIIAILSGLLMVWAKTTKVEANSAKAIIESNSKLYNSNCARCHGADGKGNTQLGQEMGIPDLTTSRMSSARVKQVIAKGDGDMPAFSKKLKAAQITSVTNYVRALRR
ncbi:MAG: cytochrome c [Acidobacteriota bacterium]